MRRPIDRLNRGRVPAKGGIFVPPPFAITDPVDLANVVSGVPIAVSGSSPGVAAVNVTGNAIAIGSSPVVGNAWSVPWTPGAVGPVALAATDGALNAAISVTVISAIAFAFTNPADLASVPVGTPITVSGTSPSASSVSVTANGVPIGSSPVVGNAWSFSWTPTIAAATTLAATDGTLNAVISITVTAAAPSNPLTIFTSVTPFFWVRADLGIVEVDGPGTGISQWLDQGPSARHFAQAANPTWRPSIANDGPNGTAMATFDGVDDIMINGWNGPAAGTTPIFIYAIIKVISQTSGDYIFGTNTGSALSLIQLAVAGQCRMNNGSNGPTNSNLTVGTARRVKILLNNALTDYLTVGGTAPTTGVNLGNSDPTNFCLGARITLNWANVGFLEFGAWAGEPNSTELADADAASVARYGAAVLG